jgi:hypothetical protein
MHIILTQWSTGNKVHTQAVCAALRRSDFTTYESTVILYFRMPVFV